MVVSKSVPFSGQPFPRVPKLIFSNCREALHRSGLSPGVQAAYSIAISGYLDYCSRNGVSVTVPRARAYMEDVVLPVLFPFFVK